MKLALVLLFLITPLMAAADPGDSYIVENISCTSGKWDSTIKPMAIYGDEDLESFQKFFKASLTERVNKTALLFQATGQLNIFCKGGENAWALITFEKIPSAQK